MSEAPRDQNFVPASLFEIDGSPGSVMPGQIDEATGRVLVDIPGATGGTVTSVSVATANGFAGTVANATTTPAITLSTTITGVLYGNGTAISALTIGSGLDLTGSTLTATNTASGTVTSVTSANTDATVATTTTTPVITIVSAPKLTTARTIGGTSFDGTANIAVALATTVTTNANLTGPVTSTGNATAIADAALSIAKTSGLQTTLDAKAPLASPTFTGNVTVPTPSASTDAVTKAYADAITQSLDIKGSVRVASTANIAIATALTNLSVIDGVTVATGDRVLLKDQTAGAENGIYVVVASGAASRSTDADTSAEVTSGMYVFVSEGTASADMGYALTTNDPITLGTTALVFTQFSGAGQITAGTGLTKTGNTIDADTASATAVGVVELATDAEMTTGTDTTRAITPANAKVELDKKVTGPASSTDNAIARFDSTTGKLVQNSGVTISDTNVISSSGVTVAGAILPDTDSTRDIGTDILRFTNGYFDNAYMSNINVGSIFKFESVNGVIRDYQDDSLLNFVGINSAVNSFRLYNAATGNSPYIEAMGTDTNIGIGLNPKGSGRVQAGGVSIPTISSTDTLTNKQITLRTSSATSTATVTPDKTTYDQYILTAQAVALTIANPSTMAIGDIVAITVTDNATARAITFGTDYVGMGQALPTTTTISKSMEITLKKITATKVEVLWAEQQ